MRFSPAIKLLPAGLLALTGFGADGRAEPIRSDPDVAAALERIRDTGVYPEYLSLDYMELHGAVAEIVERDPQSYAADLAGRVLTRVVANLEHPLISSDEEPSLTADLIDGPEPGRLHRAEFYGSLDGGPWTLLTQLGHGGRGALGGVLCADGSLGRHACAPGWHAIAMRAVVSAYAADSEEPVWSETRELPTQVYGVYRN